MHARRIDRARTGAARADRLRRILSSVQCRRGRRSQHRIVIRARRSTPFPLSPCPDMSLQPPRPSSTRTGNSGSTANGIEAAPAQLDCAAPILLGTAFTSSTLRAINAHVAVAYSSGLVF
jgi:hypothetical protein